MILRYSIFANLLLSWNDSPNRLLVSSFVISTAPNVRHTWSSVSVERQATTGHRIDGEPLAATRSSSALSEEVLYQITALRDESMQYAELAGLSSVEGAFYALFASFRQAPIPLNLRGEPFVLRAADLAEAWGQPTGWANFFTMQDLGQALEDDFLDAARGSTKEDRAKGWQITDVSVPRGTSFQEARLTMADIQSALQRGTVIFNAAGAHIPKLAGPSLACTEATVLPCALNLYITRCGERTSAPPHTDKQDVVIVQTAGRKRWKVYSPPDPALKPMMDMFARGKGDDHLSVYSLGADSGCQLLIDTTLNPGDIMFVPAAFPHTTSTITMDDGAPDTETSIHLTLGIDHHIWGLDYLCARRLALRRAGVIDTAFGPTGPDDNVYIGKCNQIPAELRRRLFAELPLGLLDEYDQACPHVDQATLELQRVSEEIDMETASAVPQGTWADVIQRCRQAGVELLDIHRAMYIAAIEEGRIRDTEAAITAHLDKKASLTAERIQRMSLFRVKRFYDQISQSRNSLMEWSLAGKALEGETGKIGAAIPDDWAFTFSVHVGVQVEAELGGAFFPATVTSIADNLYDVQFFDGDVETKLERKQIKLLSLPPVPSNENDSSVASTSLTAKQLKRQKKIQEKLKKSL